MSTYFYLGQVEIPAYAVEYFGLKDTARHDALAELFGIQPNAETHEGFSSRHRPTKADSNRLAESQRRQEEVTAKLRGSVDLHLLHSTDLQMGRVCDGSCSACRPKTRSKTRRKQSLA